MRTPIEKKSCRTAGALAIAAVTAALLLRAGSAAALVPEPDNLIYGLPTANGAVLTSGTITVAINGDETPVASYALKGGTALGERYALRVPLDSVNPRTPGRARPGDLAEIFIDGGLAGRAVIGQRGTVISLDLDTCLPAYREFWRDRDGDGYSDGVSLTACEQPPGYRRAADLAATSGDCNDLDPLVNPGAVEVCNLVDDNCNNVTDECGCPTAALTPANVDFEMVPAGTLSGARTVLVRNIGATGLSVNGVSLSGAGAAAFHLVGDGCSGAAVQPLGDCAVRVAFAPDAGGEFHASLSVVSNDPVSPLMEASLSGTGNPDADGDGVPFGSDNCPNIANAGQEDADSDGIGDACDGLPGVNGSTPAGLADLARTGQTDEYLPADDGALKAGVPWPQPRFTDNGDGTVTDRLTNLMWLADAGCVATSYPELSGEGNGRLAWGEALDFVTGINTGAYDLCGAGRHDWRLPNVNELGSLVNAGESRPAAWYSGAGFANAGGTYWSSTAWGRRDSQAWTVSLASGILKARDRDTSFGVWPVRRVTTAPAAVPETGQRASLAGGDDGSLREGMAWPQPRFTDDGGGTITDGVTGLSWAKNARTPGPEACAKGTKKSWPGALKHLECLNANSWLGHDDWRLPNRSEMRSLFNYGAADGGNWLKNEGFTLPARSNDGRLFWTSSTFARKGRFAWVANLSAGPVVPRLKRSLSSRFHLWPVRGGLVLP